MRRGRSTNRRVHAPRKFSRANFYFSGTLAVANLSDNCTNTAVLLARTLNLGEANGPGRAFADQVRGLEIGGVVLDYDMHEEGAILADLGPAALESYQGFTLMSDRLDTTGALVSGAVQWQRVQPPIAQTAAGTPGATAEDVDFPMQIHWRRWMPVENDVRLLANAGSGLFAVDGQFVRTRRETLNKKLRLFLDDWHGLFFQFSIITGPSYAVGGVRNYRLFLQGQLYYRTRF